MKKGKFHARAFRLDTLAHLRTFKHVIGLSGSIKDKEIQRFCSVFKQQICYVELPPFYGQTSTQNKTTQNRRGISTLEQWAKEIEEDIVQVLSSGRPVLIFANCEDKSEWDTMDALADRLYKSKVALRYQKIEKESDVNDKTFVVSYNKAIDHIVHTCCWAWCRLCGTAGNQSTRWPSCGYYI
jgi:hypothetical protein